MPHAKSPKTKRTKAKPRKGNLATAKKPGAPVRAPKQARSQKTFHRILQSVEKLVNDEAYEHATVSDIVRRAKCSVGAFYGRFADKDAALYALFDSRCEGLEKKVLALLKDGLAPQARLSETISQFSDCIIKHTFSNRAFIHAEQFLTSSRSSEPFWERARVMNAKFYDAFLNLLNNKRDEITHTNPESAALITLAIIGGLPRDAVKTGAKLMGAKSGLVKDFKAEIRRAVFGYLGIANR